MHFVACCSFQVLLCIQPIVAHLALAQSLQGISWLVQLARCFMAASVDALIHELTGMRSFLQSLQSGGSSEADLDATKLALVRSVVAKLHEVPMIDFQKGALLTQSITEMVNNGTISNDMRTMFTTAVVQKMQSQTMVARARQVNCPQKCLRFDRYLMEADWELLEATSNIQTAIGHVRDSAHKIGLTNPTEHTRCVLVATVLCARGQGAEPAEQKYQYYKQLTSLFHSFHPNRPHLPHLLVYPESPRLLEPSLLKNAYGDEQPLEAEVRSYNITLVASSVPSRSNHSAIRHLFNPGAPSPSRSASSGLSSEAQQLMGALTQVLNQQSGRGARTSNDAGLPGLQIFDSKRRRANSIASDLDAEAPQP